jgi:hypothetical protein
MGTTGLIYVAIVAAWAAYLVPMWLRRHDEASRTQSVERYSSAMRVLARQTDDLDRTRYVVRAQGAAVDAPRVLPPPPKRSAASNRARRVAAMRRRRVLSMLTLSLLSLTALASFAIVQWWSLGIPGGLILLFLVVARIQVRKMQRRDREYVETERAARKAARADVSPPAPDTEETIEVKLPVVEPPAVAEPPAEGLWDPVPVTLPTYVHKEKAPDRTVRTVNLSGPEVFSSARSPEYLVAPPETAEPEPVAEQPAEVRRAVGD